MVRIYLAKAAIAAVVIQDAGVVAMVGNGAVADLTAKTKINIHVAIDLWLFQETSLRANKGKNQGMSSNPKRIQDEIKASKRECRTESRQKPWRANAGWRRVPKNGKITVLLCYYHFLFYFFESFPLVFRIPSVLFFIIWENSLLDSGDHFWTFWDYDLDSVSHFRLL